MRIQNHHRRSHLTHRRQRRSTLFPLSVSHWLEEVETIFIGSFHRHFLLLRRWQRYANERIKYKTIAEHIKNVPYMSNDPSEPSFVKRSNGIGSAAPTIKSFEWTLCAVITALRVCGAGENEAGDLIRATCRWFIVVPFIGAILQAAWSHSRELFEYKMHPRRRRDVGCHNPRMNAINSLSTLWQFTDFHIKVVQWDPMATVVLAFLASGEY